MTPKEAAVDPLRFEREAFALGHRHVAGVDEVGRGCLAGPVTAASVILDPENPLTEIRDSKALSPARRQALCDKIFQSALAVEVVSVGEEVVDRINILEASKLAMTQALTQLEPRPDFVLVDALHLPRWTGGQRGIVKGDALSLSIGAASIVAKVHRDRLMDEWHEKFPQYGFKSNKGYPTKQHREALAKHGPSPIHRMSFAGVSQGELWQ